MPKKKKAGYDPNMINLSPTSIQSWFDNGCPQRWLWERSISLVDENEFGKRGTLVHKMMEGAVDPADVKDDMAVTFYNKISDLAATMQIEILHREIPHTLRIDGTRIVLRRRADAIGRLMDGTLAIFDWKTAYGYGWKQIKDTTITPQRYTLQSISYLIPPPKAELPEGIPKWPRTLIYFVGPLRGAPTPYRYDYDPHDMDSFIDAMQIVAQSVADNRFPKIKGKHCLECPMALMCYRVPGYQKLYAKRKFNF